MNKLKTGLPDLSQRKTHSYLSGPTLRELRVRLQQASRMQDRRKPRSSARRYLPGNPSRVLRTEWLVD